MSSKKFTKQKRQDRGAQAALPLGGMNTVPPLKPDTFLDAKECAPGWDVYYLENEWRSWIKEPPRYPDAAFL